MELVLGSLASEAPYLILSYLRLRALEPERTASHSPPGLLYINTIESYAFCAES